MKKTIKSTHTLLSDIIMLHIQSVTSKFAAGRKYDWWGFDVKGLEHKLMECSTLRLFSAYQWSRFYCYYDKGDKRV